MQDARRRRWQPPPSFPNLDALKTWLEERGIAQWSQITHGGLPGSVADVHAGEVASLMSLGHPWLSTQFVQAVLNVAFGINGYFRVCEWRVDILSDVVPFALKSGSAFVICKVRQRAGERQ